MAYIEVIGLDKAEGSLKEIYEQIINSRGKIANVHTIQSLNPESILDHMDLYMTLMFKKSPLKRYQREMIAVVVSQSNNCNYCQKHHAEALNHYWKDESKIEKLKTKFETAELEPIDELWCVYAKELTINPSSDQHSHQIDLLRKAGANDRAILDATMIISYFNFVNRMVLGLGVEEEENVGGYNY
ncbi:MAG: peroxidase-related enzyme [Flavobacteriales bacterium]|nr:peroxidase-related enzyme [Flavobacteriales bacterium]